MISKLFKLFILIPIYLLISGSHKDHKVFTSDLTDNYVTKVTSYRVGFSKYPAHLTSGVEGGIGSGLAFKEEKDGKLYFYTITDRGPNAEGPDTLDNEETIIFPNKNFLPYIGVVEIKPDNSADLINAITIKDDGKLVHGVFPPYQTANNKIFLPLDNQLNVIKEEHYGIDSESIAIDHKGNFWIGEEYKLLIINADKNGNVIKKYSPGNGLPAILDQFAYNRGFESIASTPNGKIYMLLESTLNVNLETKNSADFIRMVELDPSTGKTRMFAYPFEKNTYKNAEGVKVGDIEAIDNDHFLIIEQGKDKNNQMLNQIFLIDIAEATDISDHKLANGQELEYGKLNEITNKNIKLISKDFFLDPRKYGWDMQKIEGITIINKNTIAISNDNDFAIATSFTGTDANNINELTINLPNKEIMYQNTLQKDAKIQIIDQKDTEHNYIWIFNLAKDIPFFK